MNPRTTSVAPRPRTSRTLAFLAGLGLMLVLSGCTNVEREPLRPLPEGMMYTYDTLVSRARVQAGAALEAFYLDRWAELDQAAAGLEQTARLLPKAIEIPETFKRSVDADAEALRKDSARLGDAARAKNVQDANDTLQRINLKIRLLRPEQAAPAVVPKIDVKK